MLSVIATATVARLSTPAAVKAVALPPPGAMTIAVPNAGPASAPADFIAESEPIAVPRRSEETIPARAAVAIGTNPEAKPVTTRAAKTHSIVGAKPAAKYPATANRLDRNSIGFNP